MTKAEKFGKLLQSRRVESALSQTELAERLKVSQATVSLWENGKTPTPEQLKAISSVLGPLTDQAAIESQPAITAWLSRFMNEKSLTASELAQRSKLSLPTIYNLLAGRAENPHPKTILRLQSALGLTKGEHFEQSRETGDLATALGVGELIDFNPYEASESPTGVPGVYVFYDISQRPVYVGESGDIGKRLKDHVEKFWFKQPIVEIASYIEISDARLRKQVETILIRFLKSNAVINKQKTDR